MKLGLLEYQVTDPRLRNALEEVADRISREEIEQFPDLEVFEVPVTTCGANVRTSGPGVMQIRLSPAQLAEMTANSPAALRGLIAHELAHAFFRHPANGHARDGLAEEIEADDKASQWVGPAAVAAFRAAVGPPAPSEGSAVRTATRKAK